MFFFRCADYLLLVLSQKASSPTKKATYRYQDLNLKPSASETDALPLRHSDPSLYENVCCYNIQTSALPPPWRPCCQSPPSITQDPESRTPNCHHSLSTWVYHFLLPLSASLTSPLAFIKEKLGLRQSA